MTKWKLLVLLFLISIITACIVGNMSEEESSELKIKWQVNLIDSLVHELNVQDKFNGTILVSLRGEEIFSNAYGYENFERETRLSTQSSFRLNYISLQMTAMGIMILKERERLNYSDNIQTHIPEFPY